MVLEIKDQYRPGQPLSFSFNQYNKTQSSLFLRNKGQWESRRVTEVVKAGRMKERLIKTERNMSIDRQLGNSVSETFRMP